MLAGRSVAFRVLVTSLALSWGAFVASGQLPDSQKILASDGETDDWFGGSVDLHGDWAVVGARDDNDLGDRTGAAYVFQLQAGQWVEVQKLVPADGGPFWQFGGAVSIDQERLAIGAVGGLTAGAYTGAAYIYRLQAGSWVLEQRIDASDGAAQDQFGHSVDLDGNLLVIGAIGVDDSANAAGAVYVYRYDGSAWNEEAKLLGHTPISDFGWSVSADGDQLAVGARSEGTGTFRPGNAHVYTFDGSTWMLESELDPPVEDHQDFFGHSIVLRGDVCAVGAIWAAGIATKEGAAHVFRRTTAGWAHEAQVEPIGLNGMDYVGSSLDLEGDLLIVGADGVDLTNLRGAIYAFRYSGTHWSNQIPMVPMDPSSRGRMGNSVALDRSSVLAGAFYARDGTGALTGAAYAYELPPGPGIPYCFCEPGGCSGTDASAGCPNSTGAGARLDAAGYTMSDTIDLLITGARPNQFGLVFQGDNRIQIPFGGGFRCANINIVRLTPPRLVLPDGSLTFGPSAGDPPISQLGGLMPGDGLMRRYQFWYRDPAGGCGNFNLSNGYELVW